MKEHINFYENLKEAHIRLRNTVVLYDGEPCYILAITDHKKDGIFRVYMYPIGSQSNKTATDCTAIAHQYGADHPGLGDALDAAILGKEGVLRKHMNSPLFKKFRPFPLGMCNLYGKGTFYIERQPNRHTPQGLTANMLYDVEITAASDLTKSRQARVSLMDDNFRNCVLGNYPTAQECLAAMINPKIANTAGAFHRQFAFCRGPIEMVFLAYKEDIVGVLPNNNFDLIKLGRDYRHVREVIQELQLFTNIEVSA